MRKFFFFYQREVLFYKQPVELGTEQEHSRARVWNRARIESPISHEISNLEAGIDFSSSSFALSLLLSTVYHLEMFIQEEDSIPVRKQFHVVIVNLSAFHSIFQMCKKFLSVLFKFKVHLFKSLKSVPKGWEATIFHHG